MAKLVEVEKQEYVKMINDPGMRLKGEERELYKLLKSGPVKDVKPAMVKKVVDGFAEGSNEEI